MGDSQQVLCLYNQTSPHCNIPDWLADFTYVSQAVVMLPGVFLLILIIRRLKSFGNIGVMLLLLILSGPCYCLQMHYFNT